MSKNVLSKLFVFAIVFMALFGPVLADKTMACDYCYGSSYNYYDYNCSYSGSCGYSYPTQSYQFQKYPDIVYVPSQSSTGYSTPYQFQRFPDIVYVPNTQSNSYNPYNNTGSNNMTSATSNALYYQGSQIQSNGYYGNTYNGYNNGYNNSNYNYSGYGSYQYQGYQNQNYYDNYYYQNGGQFIRTN